MRLTIYDINDALTELAQRAGVDTNAEGVDETLDDLTHTVAAAFGVGQED